MHGRAKVQVSSPGHFASCCVAIKGIRQQRRTWNVNSLIGGCGVLRGAIREGRLVEGIELGLRCLQLAAHIQGRLRGWTLGRSIFSL